MPIRSPHPDVQIPDVTLPEMVLHRTTDLGDKPALIDGPSGRTITYGQLGDLVRRTAAGLAARGLRPGDVVAIFSPNLPEYAVAFHGVATAGGINTTANALYTAAELAFQLADSAARFLITIPAFMDRAGPAAQEVGIEEVFVFGDPGDTGATPFTALLAAGDEPPEVTIDPASALVTLPYSSGTTGLPKGVMLSHRNLAANIAQFTSVLQIGEQDRIIAVLPFFHIYGQVVVLNAGLYRGATVVTMPRFDLEGFLGLLQEQAITVAFLVPPIVLALAKHPIVDDYDLSNLRLIMSGAAPLDGDLAEACASRLGCRVFQGYGLTETSPVTHVVPDGQPNRPGKIGPLIPGTEARLVDVGTGDDVAAGERGEVWIRGPQVMQGYLNNPQATAMTIDDDGWLHSGDIGVADEDGWFAIVDRLKELIKYKGYQVPPAELEAVLLSNPAVADACVIPVADEEAGEIPKAFVVLKGEATPEELMAYVAERVAPHMKVRELEITDEIPKSASGKLLRRILVERERAARDGER